MKESFWSYWLIVLGVFIIVILLLIQSFTSSNTQDYYLVKSIAEASMVDAIDWSYYNTYNELKINKEKFYESFLRRFSEEASLSTTYTIEFSEVYEAPPKISVAVSSKSSSFNIAGDSETFDIKTKIDSILESQNSAETYATDLEASGITEYYSLFDSTTLDKNVSSFKNCTYKNTTGANYAVTVKACGKFINNDLYNTDANVIYCIAAKDTDSTSVVIATKESFETEYCTGS